MGTSLPLDTSDPAIIELLEAIALIEEDVSKKRADQTQLRHAVQAQLCGLQSLQQSLQNEEARDTSEAEARAARPTAETTRRAASELSSRDKHYLNRRSSPRLAAVAARAAPEGPAPRPNSRKRDRQLANLQATIVRLQNFLDTTATPDMTD